MKTLIITLILLTSISCSRPKRRFKLGERITVVDLNEKYDLVCHKTGIIVFNALWHIEVKLDAKGDSGLCPKNITVKHKNLL